MRCSEHIRAAIALSAGEGRATALQFPSIAGSTQLLMCDRYERTRSWFRVVPLKDGKTLLQFGSAVTSGRGDQPGTRIRVSLLRLLLKFHVVYSQLLLHAAKRGVMRNQPDVK
jgi:hypothetical protein